MLIETAEVEMLREDLRVARDEAAQNLGKLRAEELRSARLTELAARAKNEAAYWHGEVRDMRDAEEELVAWVQRKLGATAAAEARLILEGEERHPDPDFNARTELGVRGRA